MDLIDTIDRWARICPDRPAHISAGKTLTYAELARQSDRLANEFEARSPGGGQPIAILGHKRSEMLVGFLGAVKAGRPYVPIDHSWPRHRVDNVISTADATLETEEQLAGILDAVSEEASSKRRRLAPDDIWYVIFTSGSTGDPKGVMVSRGCLESFLSWTLDEQGFTEREEVFLNQAPFSFDLSVMDLYSSLATGGTLFSLTQSEIAEPRRLFKALEGSGVTTWVSTPSFARLCLMHPTFGREMLSSARKFWFCGETLAPEIASQLLRRFPGAEVWNTYGPTEATVATTSLKITEEVLEQYNPLPVGRVKPGSYIHILDRDGGRVPTGERGEIVIAGPNVSLGYVNRPDLTARAFLELDGMRAYRTGDMGHFEEDLLFFEGRMDFQIKLHGYRIEIGDIEAHLHGLPGIQDAVVIPALREGRADHLVAFAILNGPLPQNDFELSQTLRQRLGERLPEYMVPRKFIFLKEFPTTPNGKVDRQLLGERLS